MGPVAGRLQAPARGGRMRYFKDISPSSTKGSAPAQHHEPLVNSHGGRVVTASQSLCPVRPLPPPLPPLPPLPPHANHPSRRRLSRQSAPFAHTPRPSANLPQTGEKPASEASHAAGSAGEPQRSAPPLCTPFTNPINLHLTPLPPFLLLDGQCKSHRPIQPSPFPPPTHSTPSKAFKSAYTRSSAISRSCFETTRDGGVFLEPTCNTTVHFVPHT